MYPNYYVAINVPKLVCSHFSTQISMSRMTDFCFLLIYQYCTLNSMEQLICRTLSILSFLLCYLIHWLFFFLSISNVGVATYFLISGTLSILSLLNCCLSQITLILFFPSGIHYLYYPDCAATDFLFSNTILSFPLMSFTLTLLFFPSQMSYFLRSTCFVGSKFAVGTLFLLEGKPCFSSKML